MRPQYARRPEYPTPHLVVEHQRKLCHEPVERVQQSIVVRASGAMAFLIYLTVAADHISSTPTFPLLCDS
jgi:hypothetical protein